MKLRIVLGLCSVLLVIGQVGCGGAYSAPDTPPPGPTPSPSSVAFSITAITPSSTSAGCPDLQLTITGKGFADISRGGTRAVWNSNGVDTVLSIKDSSDIQLTTSLPSVLLQNPGTFQIMLQKYDHIEGVVTATTSSLPFTVIAPPQASVSIGPPAETLGPGGGRKFSLRLHGDDAAAFWDIAEGSGNIDSSGFYIAPANAGRTVITATLLADPTVKASAMVTTVDSGFRSIGKMNAPRTGHSALLLPSGKVLIVGGGDNRMELFDPSTNAFSLVGSTLQVSSVVSSILLLDGRVLFLGLSTGDSSPRVNMIYDPLKGDFSRVGDMVETRGEYTATLLFNGKVLITGGALGGAAAEAFHTAELFDPASGTFISIGSMLSERADHTATLLTSGQVLIAGGWNGHRADGPDDPPWDTLFAELYDPVTGAFKSTGSMSTTRRRHTATRLADGRVLFMVGILPTQNLHQQPPDPMYAEIYDPTTGQFSPPSTFTLPQVSYTTTLLLDGQVLICGGETMNMAIPSAELINVTSGTLAPTGSLVTARRDHTATLLNDGRVLVTGGTDINGNALSTAEIYK